MLNQINLSDLSKEVFGIRTATHLFFTDDNDIGMAPGSWARLVTFFEGNHSDLSFWVSTSGIGDSFYPTLADQKTWRQMRVYLGDSVTATLTRDRDWTDLVTAFNFMRQDKKRWARFMKDIIKELPAWPASTHARMIHDYCMAVMQREERKTKSSMGTTRTLPEYNLVVPAGFNILVPANDLDLSRIGKAQGHCVGTRTMGYGNKVRRGDALIFALYTNTLQDGVCVELDASHNIKQVQGKFRRGPTDKEMLAIQAIVDELH